MTVAEMSVRLFAAVPSLQELREESLDEDGTLIAHSLMADIIAWAEEHVDDRRADVVRIGDVMAQALADGDEQTQNVALVSFSEGIFPGTPLWDVVPESLRDTWSGPPA